MYAPIRTMGLLMVTLALLLSPTLACVDLSSGRGGAVSVNDCATVVAKAGDAIVVVATSITGDLTIILGQDDDEEEEEEEEAPGGTDGDGDTGGTSIDGGGVRRRRSTSITVSFPNLVTVNGDIAVSGTSEDATLTFAKLQAVRDIDISSPATILFEKLVNINTPFRTEGTVGRIVFAKVKTLASPGTVTLSGASTDGVYFPELANANAAITVAAAENNTLHLEIGSSTAGSAKNLVSIVASAGNAGEFDVTVYGLCGRLENAALSLGEGSTGTLSLFNMASIGTLSKGDATLVVDGEVSDASSDATWTCTATTRAASTAEATTADVSPTDADEKTTDAVVETTGAVEASSNPVESSSSTAPVATTPESVDLIFYLWIDYETIDTAVLTAGVEDMFYNQVSLGAGAVLGAAYSPGSVEVTSTLRSQGDADLFYAAYAQKQLFVNGELVRLENETPTEPSGGSQDGSSGGAGSSDASSGASGAVVGAAIGGLLLLLLVVLLALRRRSSKRAQQLEKVDAEAGPQYEEGWSEGDRNYMAPYNTATEGDNRTYADVNDTAMYDNGMPNAVLYEDAKLAGGAPAEYDVGSASPAPGYDVANTGAEGPCYDVAGSKPTTPCYALAREGEQDEELYQLAGTRPASVMLYEMPGSSSNEAIYDVGSPGTEWEAPVYDAGNTETEDAVYDVGSTATQEEPVYDVGSPNTESDEPLYDTGNNNGNGAPGVVYDTGNSDAAAGVVYDTGDDSTAADESLYAIASADVSEQYISVTEEDQL